MQSSYDYFQDLEAVVNADGKTVTLVHLQGQKPTRLNSRIKLVNADALDSSYLDASQSASFIVDNVFDHNKSNLTQSKRHHDNIFRSASPSSPGNPMNVPPTPQIGSN